MGHELLSLSAIVFNKKNKMSIFISVRQLYTVFSESSCNPNYEGSHTELDEFSAGFRRLYVTDSTAARAMLAFREHGGFPKLGYVFGGPIYEDYNPLGNSHNMFLTASDIPWACTFSPNLSKGRHS